MIFRCVNIKENMPTVSEATAILDNQIKLSKDYGVKVLKIIHGYGSSGKGGKIRNEVRRQLIEKKEKAQIKDVIFGENFSIFDVSTQRILHLSSEISKDSDLNNANNGITIIVLK